MEKKINIIEIIKDCPKGTKLYSPLCGECEFYRVYRRNGEICIEIKAKRDFGIGNINYDEFRLATEEEKQKLFQAIKDNGYE